MESKKYTLKELKKKLTPKEKIFCHEYIIDWNGARAARKAGYSVKGARETAHKILLKYHIDEYISMIKDDIAKEAGLTKLGLLLKLKRLSEGDISDFYDGWGNLKDFQDLQLERPELFARIQEIVPTKNGPQLKLHDARLVIQDIYKAMGWNEPDKVNMNVMEPIKGITFDL